jgi:glycosyltransferase involved in cell wall biosynthesis
MRIAVYPHELSIGGSQLNAVELAAAVRDLGHDVVVFGVPGPLAGHIERLGLELVAAPDERRRPAPAVMGRLNELVSARGIDLVHGYEWPPALEAYYGPHLRLGVPAVCTIMSMGVPRFLPASMPLLVGTEQLRVSAQRGRPGPVGLLEPPVDTASNHPGIEPDGFRDRHGIPEGRPLLVVVSRLAADLKLEGLERAIAATGQIALETPVSLAIVGDGPAADRLAARAGEVDATAGPGTVVLTGPLMDPRPAYAAADVVLGMGGSILRALAFAKPAIVLGEDGFSEVLRPETSAAFLWHGFYGLGDGDLGPDRLAAQLRLLLGDPALRADLSAYSLALVRERFSLTAAARLLERFYQEALDRRVSRPRVVTDGAAAAAGVVRYKLARRRQRRRGQAATDDFNARPVITSPPPAGSDKEQSDKEQSDKEQSDKEQSHT